MDDQSLDTESSGVPDTSASVSIADSANTCASTLRGNMDRNTQNRGTAIVQLDWVGRYAEKVALGMRDYGEALRFSQ